jgi:hypothetical protein
MTGDINNKCPFVDLSSKTKMYFTITQKISVSKERQNVLEMYLLMLPFWHSKEASSALPHHTLHTVTGPVFWTRTG